MVIIERPRQSGKTTILLHYMLINHNSVYVARTEQAANYAFKKSQELELNIDRQRFLSVANCESITYQTKILVDDADCMTKRSPSMGFGVLKNAHIITISKEQ